MNDEQILTAEQRRDMAAWLGEPNPDHLSDEELLTRAAERLGLIGELAVDPEGVLELEQDDVLMILESVVDEDADLVDHPEKLYLSVYLRPRSEEERTELVEADLLEPDAEAVGEDDGWVYAWWGGMCTQLDRQTILPDQLEALSRAMGEVQTLLERRDLPGFFKRMAWLELESED